MGQRKGVRKESINFVLSYPEILQGERTTPRSLTQFFWQIQDLDLNDPGNYDLLESLSLATLEEDAAYSFIGYVKEGCPEYVSAERILTTNDIDGVLKVVKNDCFKTEQFLPDRIWRIWENLILELKKTSKDSYLYPNIKAFMLMEWLGSESRQSFYHELSTIRSSLDKSIKINKKGPRRP